MTSDCLVTAVYMLDLWRAGKPGRGYTLDRDPRAKEDDLYPKRDLKAGEFLLGAVRIWFEDTDGSVDGRIFWENEDLNDLGDMLTRLR